MGRSQSKITGREWCIYLLDSVRGVSLQNEADGGPVSTPILNASEGSGEREMVAVGAEAAAASPDYKTKMHLKFVYLSSSSFEYFSIS